jgi:hypothetical protein
VTYEHRIDSERSPYAVQLDDLSRADWDDERDLEHERAQAQRRGSEPGKATVIAPPASSPGAPAVTPALGVRSTDNTQGEQHGDA